jgi:integrase
VFATRNGTWQQVTNIERRRRKGPSISGSGAGDPHIFRKTVAILISERVDADTASQQLGHSSPAITREIYIAKLAIPGDVAHVIQELANEAWRHLRLLLRATVCCAWGLWPRRTKGE